MKLLLATLGSLTITGSSAAVLSNSTNTLVSANKNLTLENPTSDNLTDFSKYLEKYLENNPNSTLKEDILTSLSFINQEIQVNLTVLEKYKSDSDLYKFLSQELKTNLDEMYKKGFLIYDNETKQFNFKDFVSNFSWGAWAEHKWYWFIWWKLHINHEASHDLSVILLTASSVGEFAAAAGNILPAFGTFIAAASIFLMANSYIFSSYDKGNGIWLGFLGVIPDLGWGSN